MKGKKCLFQLGWAELERHGEGIGSFGGRPFKNKILNVQFFFCEFEEIGEKKYF